MQIIVTCAPLDCTLEAPEKRGSIDFLHRLVTPPFS